MKTCSRVLGHACNVLLWPCSEAFSAPTTSLGTATSTRFKGNIVVIITLLNLHVALLRGLIYSQHNYKHCNCAKFHKRRLSMQTVKVPKLLSKA